MTFRESPYIDFNAGVVLKPPMDLAAELEEPRSLPDKLALFECRVDVWQFGPAVEMLKKMECHRGTSSVWAHAAFALLAVGFSYFEMLGKTLNPGSKPWKGAPDFKSGFWDVYPQFRSEPEDTKQFHDRVRNGLYHLAFTKKGLLLHNPECGEDFLVDRSKAPPVYLVDPHRMTRRIVEHFPTFLARLRAPCPSAAALQKRFKRFFDDYFDPAS